MPRSVWNGSISFGLVNIPVRLYPATQSRDPRFHMVDRRTGRRVRYRRVVEEPASGSEEGPAAPEAEPSKREEAAEDASSPERREREVPYEEVARGYDVGGGQQIVVEREELEALRPERSRSIDVEHFVRLAEIDPVHYEKSYFLAPAEDLAEKPYTLLRVSMERTERVAIGRFVLRSREHLVVIRPTAGILGLETVYFEDEVRRPADRWILPAQKVEAHLTATEIGMAERLIDAMAVDWDPSRYGDPYRERVLDLIRSRSPVAEPAALEEPAAPAVTDLMDALRASVDAIKDASKPRRAPKAGGAGRR